MSDSNKVNELTHRLLFPLYGSQYAASLVGSAALEGASDEQVFIIGVAAVRIAGESFDTRNDKFVVPALEFLCRIPGFIIERARIRNPNSDRERPSLAVYRQKVLDFYEQFFWEVLLADGLANNSDFIASLAGAREFIYKELLREWRIDRKDGSSYIAFRRLMAMGWGYPRTVSPRPPVCQSEEYATQERRRNCIDAEKITSLIREHKTTSCVDIVPWLDEPDMPHEVFKTIVIGLIKGMHDDPLRPVGRTVAGIVTALVPLTNDSMRANYKGLAAVRDGVTVLCGSLANFRRDADECRRLCEELRNTYSVGWHLSASLSSIEVSLLVPFPFSARSFWPKAVRRITGTMREKNFTTPVTLNVKDGWPRSSSQAEFSRKQTFRPKPPKKGENTTEQ